MLVSAQSPPYEPRTAAIAMPVMSQRRRRNDIAIVGNDTPSLPSRQPPHQMGARGPRNPKPGSESSKSFQPPSSAGRFSVDGPERVLVSPA